jgi:hypothetical protein
MIFKMNMTTKITEERVMRKGTRHTGECRYPLTVKGVAGQARNDGAKKNFVSIRVISG